MAGGRVRGAAGSGRGGVSGGREAQWRGKRAWRTPAGTATFPEAVRENEEVVPVNAVSTWVLPSGVTVGR